jgi:endo-1,4-beta-xylanase
MKRQSFILGSAAAMAAGPLLSRLAWADAETLRAAAAAKGIVYGSNYRDIDLLTANPDLAELTVKQCALIESGRSFQWLATRPSPTTFDFAKADAFVNWGTSRGLKIAECHLLWHRGQPKWLAGYLNSSNWRDLLANHVHTVVSRYAGKIHYWVVVNEAIQIKDGRSDGLRNSDWIQLGGQEVIDLAFRTAGTADPKAQLIYNDYSIEADTPNNEQKRKVLLAMIAGMKERGVPIHGVGIQAHLNGSRDFQGAGLGNFIEDIGKMGLKVYVTELDTGDDQLPSDENGRDVTMAKIYKTFLDIVLAHKNVDTVVQWSLTDKYFWRNDWRPDGPGHRPDGRADRGVPFGTNMEPTPIFNAILDAFHSAPAR